MRVPHLLASAVRGASIASVSVIPARAIGSTPAQHPNRQSFTLHDGRFHLNGKPFQMNSGQVPYERIFRAGPDSYAEWKFGGFLARNGFPNPIPNRPVTRTCAMPTNHASAAMHQHAIN